MIKFIVKKRSFILHVPDACLFSMKRGKKSALHLFQSWMKWFNMNFGRNLLVPTISRVNKIGSPRKFWLSLGSSLNLIYARNISQWVTFFREIFLKYLGRLKRANSSRALLYGPSLINLINWIEFYDTQTKSIK